MPYLRKIGRRINRRLLEVERVSHNSGLSGDSIRRVVQPTVTEDGKKSRGLKFGQPRVMALFLALTVFHHLIDGFHNHHLRQHVVDLPGVSVAEYTSNQMSYDLRRLRLKGLICRPPKTNRYFVTPYGGKVARLFSRLDAGGFRPPWRCSPATTEIAGRLRTSRRLIMAPAESNRAAFTVYGDWRSVRTSSRPSTLTWATHSFCRRRIYSWVAGDSGIE